MQSYSETCSYSPGNKFVSVYGLHILQNIRWPEPTQTDSRQNFPEEILASCVLV
jgi:hypothetical protein